MSLVVHGPQTKSHNQPEDVAVGPRGVTERPQVIKAVGADDSGRTPGTRGAKAKKSTKAAKGSPATA